MHFKKVMSVILICKDIFNKLPTASLITLTSTWYENHAAVLMYIQHQIAHLLTHFISSLHEFLLTLGIAHSIISGSTMLKMLFGYENSYWLSSNLDLYTPVGCMSPFHEYLLADRYMNGGMVTRSLYAGSVTHSITTFWCRELKVNVVESRKETVLMPIFEFHSTMLMNFISANAIFSAYPLLTAAGHTVINPAVFYQGQVKIPVLFTLLKYRMWGFNIQTTVDVRRYDLCSELTGHICKTACACACTFCNSQDHVTMWIHSEDWLEDGNEVATLGSVIWHLGGHCCTSMHGNILPYVLWRVWQNKEQKEKQQWNSKVSFLWLCSSVNLHSVMAWIVCGVWICSIVMSVGHVLIAYQIQFSCSCSIVCSYTHSSNGECYCTSLVVVV